jgi:uncharacterized membrane protein
MEILQILTRHLADIAAYGFSFLLFGGYHLYLRSRLRRDRAYTIQSVNNHARVAWVENVMSDKSRGILGVQTLRNSTMAATFLASTAILLIMGVLNLMRGSGEESVLHSLQTGLIGGGTVQEIKLLVLLSAFFTAFFSFSLAVRLYNHIGYLINSSNSNQQFCPTSGYVSRLLNRSGRYYSYGMRAYYLSVPLVFGLFSPYYMVLGSIVLVAALYHIDRAPDTQAGDGDIRKHALPTRFRYRPTTKERGDSPAMDYDAARAAEETFPCRGPDASN